MIRNLLKWAGRGAAFALVLLLVLPGVARSSLVGWFFDSANDRLEALYDILIPSGKTLTTECGTDDCGVELKENASNPTAPAAGQRIIHCKSDGCYILENGGTATPGDSISTGGSSLMACGSYDVGSADTYWIPFNGFFNSPESAEADANTTMAVPVTVSKFCCASSITFDSGDIRVQDLKIAGSDSGFQITLDNSTQFACDETGTDTTIAAGETAVIESDETAGSNAGSGGTISCQTWFTED